MHFFPLFRSYYTFYSGIFSPERVVECAKRFCYETPILCDRDGLYGAIKFYKLCRSKKLNPLIGVELTSPSKNYSLFLIAKNFSGYESIAKLITRRKLHQPTMEFEREIAIESQNGGIFILASDIEPIYLLLKENILKNSLFIRICGDNEIDAKGIKAKEVFQLPFALAPLFSFENSDEIMTHKILRRIKHKNQELFEPSLLRKKNEFEIYGEIDLSFLSKMEIKLPLREFLLPKIKDGEDEGKKLKKLAFIGLAKRIKNITEKYIRRLSSELETITNLGFAGYFLLVKEIADYATSMNFPYLGRGSGASSLVSYSLFLTHVDPVKHNLYFERFLNPERKNLPDIDLDFSSVDRDFVIDEVIRKYGEDYVSMISTHNTFSARSAFREVAKTFSIEEEEISIVADAIPHTSYNNLKKAMTLKPQAKKINFREKPFSDVFKNIKKIDGFPRHLSVHCGGIVVSPIPLNKRTPLERSAKGVPITQYDMFDIEDLGLVKIDLLGNRSLALLTEAVATIKEETGTPPPIFPPEKTFEDKNTVKTISSGETMGCFYIESPAMRQLLKRLKTKTFDELTVASSIIRPGVAESGMMETYIRRAKGEEEVKYLHPQLNEILSETFGVMVYQEDVLRVVNEFIGLSLSEADLIRRAMSGKYRCISEMEKLGKKFFIKGREKNINETVLSELWEQIRSFAGYAFCKAHSASFAQLSFQCAYLKTHYKSHFFSALINNCGGFYPTSAYIEEARRCGLKILPPDINLSEDTFRGKNDELRCGFFVLKGVRRKLLERLYEERGEGNFASFSDFLSRLKGSYTLSEIEKLIFAGSLDSFSSNRGHLLYLLQKTGGNFKEIKNFEKEGFFSRKVIPSLPKALQLGHFARITLKEDKPLTLSELLEGEKFALGFCVTAHPLTPLIPFALNREILFSKDVKNYEGKKIKIFGQVITYKKIVTKKSSEGMAFATLEDPYGLTELVFFPSSYSRYGSLIFGEFPIIVTGVVGKEGEGFPVTVDSVESMPFIKVPKAIEYNKMSA